MRYALMTLAVAFALTAVSPGSARAQDADWDRWWISIAGGYAHAETAGSLARDLRVEDWDDTSPPGWFSSGMSYPDHADGRESLTIRLGYRFRPSLGIAFQHSTDPLGYARGYRAGELSGVYIDFEPSVRSDALLASYFVATAGERVVVKLDAGPALFQPDIGGDGDKGSSRLGAVIGAGAALRIWNVRLSVDAQRRYVGDVRYGDYDVPTTNDGVQTFGVHDASFDHDAVFVGIGLTF